MPRPERIALVHHGTQGWSGGPTFLRMLAHSLGAACAAESVELLALLPPDDLEATGSAPVTTVAVDLSARAGTGVERRLRALAGKPPRSDVVREARRNHVSVTVLSATFPDEAHYLTSVGWIPDFQHVHLPDYFSEQELRHRDETFLRLARDAELILLSSESARGHFQAFAPAFAEKGRVASFPSLLAFEPPGEASSSAASRFNLPEKFALVANQLWSHKNHEVVVEALRLLREDGVVVPVAVVGLPLDYRDPANRTVSRLLQRVAETALSGQVSVLGLVEHADLVDLTRRAALVVQPSRFEGWSTVVEDCKSLGRPLLCSDLDVHREQAPRALGFFPCDSPEALAELLAEHWPALEPGPDPEAERTALATEQNFARRHGETLLAICREAYERSGRT